MERVPLYNIETHCVDKKMKFKTIIMYIYYQAITQQKEHLVKTFYKILEHVHTCVSVIDDLIQSLRITYNMYM
jgi:DUF438 domain-containing protein